MYGSLASDPMTENPEAAVEAMNPDMDESQLALAGVLRGAREECGLSVWGAAGQSGIHHITLGRIEGKWDPCPRAENLTLFTVCALVKMYWPRLKLHHFLPDTELRFAARDDAARRRMIQRRFTLVAGSRPRTSQKRTLV